MPPKVIVLGWDSATFDVIDPLIEQGRLPALSSLMRRGVRAPLRSVWPPMTDCAWTCAFTGVNPGRHGIYGSWYRAPGAYACRYFSSRDRSAPASWELTNDVRHLVWSVPMAFPPEPIEGVMVAGYGAPPGSQFCEPKEIQRELAARWPLEDLLDRAPHSSLESFFDDLVRGADAQAEALVWLARHSEVDAISAVFPQVDRAQHFFWALRGSDHRLGQAVEGVYEALDAATRLIVESFPDADVMVVSDHGAGDLKADVNVGAWLSQRGDAVHVERARSKLLGALWALPPPVRKLGRRLAPGVARKTFFATLSEQLGSFDWSRTKAFVGFHGDLWLNLEGREPNGIVSEAEAPALLEELRGDLLQITDPASGEAVFEDVHARDEIYSGPHADMGPDLMIDAWSRGYRVAFTREPAVDIVAPPKPLAGVDVAWSSDHRPVGIFVGAGPHISSGELGELSLYDVCPTMLALLDQPVPEDLDGRVARSALSKDFLEAHPIRHAGSTSKRASGGDYSEDEAAAVAAHLKDLGYIE